MIALSKSSIVNKNGYRRVRTWKNTKALLSPIVITEYLSSKHIDLSDGASVGYVIDTMTTDQYKLLLTMGQEILFHELKSGMFVVIVMVLLFFL